MFPGGARLALLFVAAFHKIAALEEAAVSVDGGVTSSAADGGAAPSPPAVSFAFEHSFGLDLPFEPRGTLDLVPISGTRSTLALSDDLTLSPGQRDAFAALLAADGLYRTRVRSRLGGGGDGDEWVVASMRACDLVKAGFKEELKVLLDAHPSHPAVASLDYRAPQTHLSRAKDCRAAGALPDTVRFSSSATAVSATPGQTLAVSPTDGAAANGGAPPGVPPAMVQRAAANGKDGAPGAQPPQNKSFLMKYWYIILPAMILLMSPPPAEEPRPDGDQGATGGPPPAR